MSSNIATIKNLVKLLGAREVAEVVRLSKRQEALERQWVKVVEGALRKTLDKVLANADKTGRLAVADVTFDRVVMEHSLAVMREGIDSTKVRTPVRAEKLAAPPKAAVPRSLKALRELWDKYRQTGHVPPRQRAIAKRVREAFLKQLQEAWREYSEDYLSGNTASKTEAEAAIRRRLDVAGSRAKMIVETETTYYFNKARRQIYDESDDVTHYLFVAIRDHATTKWCKTRNGLVYAKSDPLLDDETPPIHWNCRSELLPLLRHNPSHLRLIKDESRQRRKHRCEPLPKEWTGHRRSG